VYVAGLSYVFTGAGDVGLCRLFSLIWSVVNYRPESCSSLEGDGLPALRREDGSSIGRMDYQGTRITQWFTQHIPALASPLKGCEKRSRRIQANQASNEILSPFRLCVISP